MDLNVSTDTASWLLLNKSIRCGLKSFYEKGVDVDSVTKDIEQYKALFNTILQDSNQDWDFIKDFLEEAAKEINIYMDWLTNGESKKLTYGELALITDFKEIIDYQISSTHWLYD